MRENLYRLMKKQADGSYKVVGYQFQQGGKIYHAPTVNGWFDDMLHAVRQTNAISDIISHPYFYKHDRIDQYTGVDVDNVKVFERDIIEYSGHLFTIRYDYDRFLALPNDKRKVTHSQRLRHIMNLYKIIGIEGVTNEQA